MERIWWGNDKHDGSNRHCGACFHIIKWETDGLGKGLFCDISKYLKISGADNSTLFQWVSHVVKCSPCFYFWHEFHNTSFFLFNLNYLFIFPQALPCLFRNPGSESKKGSQNTKASTCVQRHAPFPEGVFCRTWPKSTNNCKIKMSSRLSIPMNYAS